MNELAQVRTIAKLEIGRAFFSRRALWVYLLALFPAVIFIGHGVDVTYKKQRWSAHGATPSNVLEGFSNGASDEEVLKKAGQPILDRQWNRRRHRKESEDLEDISRRTIAYFDGKRLTQFDFEGGKLTRTSQRPLLTFDEDRAAFAAVFQYFYLRLAIFFGCLGIFINLFRGEMLDKSLHFWFLAPVRREMLLLGKYCAGLIASVVIFGTGTLIAFIAMLAFQDSAEMWSYWQADGAYHLTWYVIAAALGCIGYGSVFVAAGLLLRNPIIPAVVMLLWESINGFLPSVLQKLSVLHYLQSICPVAAPMDANFSPALRMLLSPAAPSPAWQSIGGLLCVTVLVLFVASRAVRRLEINYGTD